MIVFAMQHAQNGSPSATGIKVGDSIRTPSGQMVKVTALNLIKVGDSVRTPSGLILTVTAFNLHVLMRAVLAGWPNKPHATPQKFAGPRLLFKRRG